jgi:putative Mg2+ transporter-C (MgtC) family protein
MMSMTLAQFAQPFDFDQLQQIVVANGAIGRLLVACLLGGLVGMDREFNRKSAGVRTNLLISMGCAFFTLLSAVLAGDGNPDKGRVAANIVQGIGFLGAGLILHNRNRVSGLTSAASVFVVASIGMACGAGLYAAAGVATIIVITALEVVGFIERRANIKAYSLVYEARGTDQAQILNSILKVMDSFNQRLSGVESNSISDLQRISFSVTTTKRQHEHLRAKLLTEPAITVLHTYFDPEED